MRWNRETLILIVVSLVVIVAVLLFNSYTATAPEGEATEEGDTTPMVFPDLSSEQITRFEVREVETDAHTVLVKDDNDIWSIAEATNSRDLPVNQVQATGRVDMFGTLEAQDHFEADELAQFGLDAPAYTLTATTEDDTVYTLQVGGQNPGSTAYYTMKDGEDGMIYLVRAFRLRNFVVDMIENPPYQEPTAEATVETAP